MVRVEITQFRVPIEKNKRRHPKFTIFKRTRCCHPTVPAPPVRAPRARRRAPGAPSSVVDEASLPLCCVTSMVVQADAFEWAAQHRARPGLEQRSGWWPRGDMAGTQGLVNAGCVIPDAHLGPPFRTFKPGPRARCGAHIISCGI